MKKISDYAGLELGRLTGAVCHHAFLTENADASRRIREDIEFICQNGYWPYIYREYLAPEKQGKSIIISSISGKLYVTDGNRHCVTLTAAVPEITIGHLLSVSPRLIRYWEEGREDGGDERYMPYDTYIPIGANVSRIPGARQGTDDKGDAINIIPSDIPYDSDLFDDADKGRLIIETADFFVVSGV